MNLGVTVVAAPNPASSSVSRYSRTARGASSVHDQSKDDQWNCRIQSNGHERWTDRSRPLSPAIHDPLGHKPQPRNHRAERSVLPEVAPSSRSNSIADKGIASAAGLKTKWVFNRNRHQAVIATKLSSGRLHQMACRKGKIVCCNGRCPVLQREVSRYSQPDPADLCKRPRSSPRGPFCSFRTDPSDNYFGIRAQ